VLASCLLSAVLACRVIQDSSQQSVQSHNTWAANFCLSGMRPPTHWCTQNIVMRKHFLCSSLMASRQQYLLTQPPLKKWKSSRHVLGNDKGDYMQVSRQHDKHHDWLIHWLINGCLMDQQIDWLINRLVDKAVRCSKAGQDLHQSPPTSLFPFDPPESPLEVPDTLWLHHDTQLLTRKRKKNLNYAHMGLELLMQATQKVSGDAV